MEPVSGAGDLGANGREEVKDYSREIAKALLEIEAIGFVPDKPITFKSGIKSPVYIDNRKLPYYPDRWKLVLEGFENVVRSRRIDVEVVAGIETAGIPHSAALGYRMGKPSVFVRKKTKDHGTKSKIEGGEVKGKRVLLIEDHVSTGGSSLAGVEALKESGAMVEVCLAITSYEFGEAHEAFEMAGVGLYTLTTFSVILDEAVAAGKLNDETLGVVRDWLGEPKGWAGRHGF